MRDHDPISIDDFRGLFDRGEDEGVPKGFFISSQNNRFIRKSFLTREGSSIAHAISSVRRMAPYKRVGEAMRYIILDGTGHLYDSTNLGSPILTMPEMVDFSMVSIYNRAYITPHNGLTGLPGKFVHVYQGSGLAREAGGSAPSGASVVPTDSSESGFVEKGQHIIGVCFQSDTGFISPPAAFAVATNAGGFKLNVDNIPLGPPGTVARLLVSSQRLIIEFNGNFADQTYFFIPGGAINDNVTTFSHDTLSYYDSMLTDDASYLLDILDKIPAGVGIGEYNSRMIVWGEDAHPSLVRASVKGEPEAHDSTEGYLTVNPGDASSGVKFCFGHNTLLICQKSQRSYYAQDNDENAAFWPVKMFDASVGTECHAVAQILDYGHEIENLVVTGHPSGLRLYNGTFNLTPLTFSIDDVWSRINKHYFHTVEVILNPYDCEIFVVVPLDGATTPTHILYGDFTEGLDAEKMKWDIWDFPNLPTTILMDIDFTTREALLKWGSIDGNIYKMDELMDTDYGNAIDAWGQMALLPDDTDDVVQHFTGTRVRAVGSGLLNVLVSGLDDVLTTVGETINLSAAPGKAIFSGFNFTSERCSVKFRVNAAGHKYKMMKYNLYTTFDAEQK